MMGTIKKKRNSHNICMFPFRQIQLVNLCTELCEMEMERAKGQRNWWNLPHHLHVQHLESDL